MTIVKPETWYRLFWLGVWAASMVAHYVITKAAMSAAILEATR